MLLTEIPFYEVRTGIRRNNNKKKKAISFCLFWFHGFKLECAQYASHSGESAVGIDLRKIKRA